MKLIMLIYLVIIIHFFKTSVYSQSNAYRTFYSSGVSNPYVNHVYIIQPDFETIDTIVTDKVNEQLSHGFYLKKNHIYYIDFNTYVYIYDSIQNKLVEVSNLGGSSPNFNNFFEIDSIVYVLLMNPLTRKIRIVNVEKDHIIAEDSLINFSFYSIRHCNGRDWIILSGFNKYYVNFDATNYSNRIIDKIFDGEQLIPTLQNYHLISENLFYSNRLGFQFSPNGRRVVFIPNPDKVVVGDFSRKTGKITNTKNITSLIDPYNIANQTPFNHINFYSNNESFYCYTNQENLYIRIFNIDTETIVDSVVIPLRSIYLSPSIMEQYGFTDTSRISFLEAILTRYVNNFFLNKKTITKLRMQYRYEAPTGQIYSYPMTQIFITDFSDLNDIKFKRIHIAGQPVGSSYNEYYSDSLQLYFSDNRNFSYLPTELTAGFEYNIERNCEEDKYVVNFKDTSCCHFYRLWDFGDGTVSDTLWVTQHAEFLNKIDSFQTVSHTFIRPGRYKVKLKILNPYNYGAHLPLGEFVMDSVEKWIEIPECILPGVTHAENICIFDSLVVKYTGTRNYNTLYLTEPQALQGSFVGDSIVLHWEGQFPSGPITLWFSASNATYDTTWSSLLTLLDCDELWIPNAFSPNRDGVNDVFSYVCRGCVWNQLKVFNRDAQPIYSCEGATPCVWKGNTERGVVEEGVYVYRLKVRKWDGREVERIGTVTVLR